MPRDPILEELWRIKDEIAAEHDYDVRKLIKDLVRLQEEDKARGVKYVTLSPKRFKPAPATRASHDAG
jgi:hypothetical protein